MKQWTVMLVPHDRGGGTRSLNLCAYHIYAVVSVFLILSFTSAFLLQKYRSAARDLEVLRHRNAQIEQTYVPGAEGPMVTEAVRAEIERDVQEEYEQRIAAITEELDKVFVFEDEVRDAMDFKPRVRTMADFSGLPTGGTATEEDGKGGPPGEPPGDIALQAAAGSTRPPCVIYGLSRPSADLLKLEIDLRIESLQDLLSAARDHNERIARLPGIWPSEEPGRHRTSRFGYRRDPFTDKTRFHSGLDIGARAKSPVIATGRGVVSFSGYERYYGNVVRIDHGYGYETVYAHLAKRFVEEGQAVERYEKIGLLGSTGRSTGPHIHYEVRINGKPVDPEKYFKE